LIECLSRIGILLKGHAVEVGGNDGLYCSNTAWLLKAGWSGLFVEADWNLHKRCVENWWNYNVISKCAKVNGENVNAFVDDRCDVFSTDTDGADYEIFKGLEAKPKICIVEIDSSLPPGDEGFNEDGGASYRTMVQLGISKGYFLLCHVGNCIFVRNDFRHLFPEIIGDGLSNVDLYFNRSWLKAEAA
jgi:hypothetical protein